MDHRELIAEMAYIEKLSTQERLKLARRRRMQQLKKCAASEREQQQSAGAASKREKTAHNEAQRRRRQAQGKRVVFVASIMLLEAAARNDIEEVRELLQQEAVSPNATNEDGLTALHQCCIDDSSDMLTLLLQHGADVNAADSEKWTPLHAAATCGHLHLARLLVQHGANLLAVNADGNMPYDICEDDATLDFIECEMARRGVTQSLIDSTRTVSETAMLEELRGMKQRGEALLVRDAQGATPLHIAAANGYLRVAEFLVSHNFPLELRDCDDWTPLHAAACWGHPDVLELLVQHGASLHARNRNHETPYDICEDPDLRERVLQLLTEQETKRLGDHQRRIRRGHSANTRTQSVRRTSIRDKSLTAKKEAQEEARLRILLTNTDKNAASSQANDGNRSDKSTPFAGANTNNEAYEKREAEEQPRTAAVGQSDDVARSTSHKISLTDGKLKNNVKVITGTDYRTHDGSESFLLGQHQDDNGGLVRQEDTVVASAAESSKSTVTRVDSSKSQLNVARSLSGVHSALSNNNNAKRKTTESDYGGAFYSSYHDNRLSDDVPAEPTKEEEEEMSKEVNDAEEEEEVIYYDDSVNSGYSNSDLVLSHFGPTNVDMIRTLALTAAGPAPTKGSSSITTTSFPSVVADATPDNTDPVKDMQFVTQQTRQQDVVVIGSETRNAVIGQVSVTSTGTPNAVSDHASRRNETTTHQFLKQGEERPTSGLELTNRDLYWGRTESTTSDDDGMISRVGDGASSERDQGTGLLTSTEDSVVPLLDPQPDLIPESVRRKPPKPAKPNILLTSRGPAPAVPSPPIQITAGKFPKPVPAPPSAVQVFSAGVRQNSLTGSTSSGADSFVLSKGASPADLPNVGRTSSNSSSADPVSANGDSSSGVRVFQARPVPPPRTSSVKSNDSDADYRSGDSGSGHAEDAINSGKSSNNSSPNSDERREKQFVDKQPPCAAADQPDSAACRQDVVSCTDVVSTRAATYDSQYNTYDSRHGTTNGGIDIHVTVTVKPLAPGTLADLKQQRALNRGAPGGDIGGHPLAVGTYSLGGESMGRHTPSSTLGRKNQLTASSSLQPTSAGSRLHSGEVNNAFDNTSVNDSVATGLNSTGVASSDTASTVQVGYRPPVSPTQTPRRYHGEPSDYPTPVESKSCCVIL